MRARAEGILCIVILFLAFSLMVSLNRPARASEAAWQTRLDPWVITQAAHGEVEFIVYLQAQADLEPAAQLRTKLEKGRWVYQTLTQLAKQTQPPLIHLLEEMGVAYQPFWIANMIWVRGNITTLEKLANHPAVAHIYANPSTPIQPAQPTASPDIAAPHAIEWNLLKIGADRLWAAGAQGQGVVIGGQDTGYEWEHPALRSQYRGWDGVNSSHDYNWHDAIHADDPHTLSGNPCGFDSNRPCDDHGHGTHTMGIVIGDDGGANQIGMAPAARWIGCRNMEQGWGTPATYAECYQWFLAPTDLQGENPDPTRAPDIINNSWGCPPEEGCTDPTILQAVVEAARAAGILSVHAAGNTGPECGSIDTPAAIYDASFTVGNSTAADALAYHSSRGPVLVDGSYRLKPDVVAPGTNIRSAWLNGNYQTLSGTSMAAPHVAGLAALLISAQPELAGQVDRLEALISHSAIPLQLEPIEYCAGIPSTVIPNPSFGWGRIDAWAAYQALYPFPYYLPMIFKE